MTTPKCPLCGSNFKLDDSLCRNSQDILNNAAGPTVYFCRCDGCGLSAEHCGNPVRAWEKTEEFISKFPPIMRLRQGDNVMVHFGDGAHTVLYTNVDRGKIYLQDVYGNAQSYDVDEIEKWPWELEQEGGQQ